MSQYNSFENSETVLFSFKIMHQQCSLKFQENVLIGCPEKKVKLKEPLKYERPSKSPVIYNALSEHGQFLKELGKNMISPIC